MQNHFLLYSWLATIVLSLVGAQDLSQIPSCAQAPALSSIGSTGCALTDFACICKDQAFIDSLAPLIKQVCSAADVQKVYALTQRLCGSVGVTISDPALTATSVPSGILTQPAASASPTASTAGGSGISSIASSATGSRTTASASSAAVASSISAANTVNGRLDGWMVLLGAVGVAVSWLA